MSQKKDIIIIGAGVIGCSIGYALGRAGKRVTIVERGMPGDEASSAAAGMIAPYSEMAQEELGALETLMLPGRSMYPQWLAEVEHDSGFSIPYYASGSIVLADDDDEMESIVRKAVAKQDRSSPQKLRGKGLQQLEPEIDDKLKLAVLFPEDHYLDNRRLMQALVAALRNVGVEIRTGTPVLGLTTRGQRVSAVRTAQEELSADWYINAAGSWSNLIHEQIPTTVHPIRGQIVRLQLAQQLLHHLVFWHNYYLVPWPDGRVLVGSTMEDVGYNKDVTADGIKTLLNSALQMVPRLQTAGIRASWAGFRPATRDGLPLLGKLFYDNLIVATGHFRNGILLAPITAQLITELLLTGEPDPLLAPFNPERFIV